MVEYYEDSYQGDILRKFTEINDFIATYHIRTYGGCEFGCAYCDGWSHSDQAIDEKICSYSNLLERLSSELKSIKSDEAIGLTLSDPYQPAEQHFRLTRKTLELLNNNNRSAVILTKSPLVLDDINLIKKMNVDSFTIVATTIVTLNEDLSALLESKSPDPVDRIELIGKLKSFSIPCGFVLNPIIPFITDDKQDIFNLLKSLASVSPDFILWEYLWIPNSRHRNKIVSILEQIDNNIASKFDTLYMNNSQPSIDYRESLDKFMIQSFKQLGIEPRIPIEIYQDYLNPDKVKHLKERNTAFIQR